MKLREDIQWDLSQKIMDENSRVIADIACRTGKIKITLDTILSSEKVLVVYPDVSIKQSWKNDLIKWKVRDKKRFKFSTYLSFKKIRDMYDVLVLDECQSISEAQLSAISLYMKHTGIKKVIGLSGSLNDETKQQLKNYLGLETKVKYSIQQAIDDGITSDYNIEVRIVPLSIVNNIKIVWKGGEFFTSEKANFDYITRQIDNSSGNVQKMARFKRMRAIMNSISKIEATKQVIKEKSNERLMCFCGLTDVADSLGIDVYHSKNSNEQVKQDFINGSIDKLAVVRQLNAGVTFPKLNTAVINYFDSNAENQCQRISRITNMDYVGKIANIIIISSNEEVELRWLRKSLEFFDKSKITYKYL